MGAGAAQGVARSRTDRSEAEPCADYAVRVHRDGLALAHEIRKSLDERHLVRCWERGVRIHNVCGLEPAQGLGRRLVGGTEKDQDSHESAVGHSPPTARLPESKGGVLPRRPVGDGADDRGDRHDPDNGLPLWR